VLGSPQSAAAKIVSRLGIGMVVPYDRQQFVAALKQMTSPDLNLNMRQRAFSLASRFGDRGAAEWIWQSLAKGEPIDRRYEDLTPDTDAS
jgi:hypothetical protein